MRSLQTIAKRFRMTTGGLIIAASSFSLVPLAGAGEPPASRLTPQVRAVQNVRSSVVNIRGKKTLKENATQSADFDRQVNGMGTGVIVDSRGYIVTNYHVIEGVARIQVTLVDKKTYEAKLIARDPKTDLAVIKINTDEKLPVIPLGDSDDLFLAEDVIAIGNAYGYENSVTTGIISELNRTVQVSDEQIYYDLIQTDASINPGNSGGPLLNIEGKMIGINVAVRVGAQGIGFAIPTNQALDVIADLISTHTRAVSSHGITGHIATESGGKKFVVDQVAAKSAAATAGIEVGDVIKQVGDIEIKHRFDLERAFLDRQVGEEVAIEFDRTGAADEVKLVVAKPTVDIVATDAVWSKVGLKLSPIAKSEFQRISTKYAGGMRVADVRKGSPAEQRGLRRGDVLVAMHIWETASEADIKYIMAQDTVLNSPEGVSFLIIRGNQEFFGNLEVASNTKKSISSTR